MSLSDTTQHTGRPIRVAGIVDGTSVDGPGLRTSIYVAGCAHTCPGCHNRHTWPFDSGEDYTVAQLLERIADNDFDVTLSGGDPLYQAEALLPLVRAVKAMGKTVWCYTGFVYEQVKDMEPYASLLKEIDVLVDGPFVESLADPSLRFRGSSNQRIISPADGQILG